VGSDKIDSAELYSTTNGTTWTEETTDGFGTAANTTIAAGVAFNNYIYVGTNGVGEVWRTAAGGGSSSNADPVFSNLPDSDTNINIAEDQTITTNPFMIRVKPTDKYGIAKVEFEVDDNLICTDTEADADGVYECAWDTSKYHSAISVTAYDDSGNTTIIERNTTVDPSLYSTSSALSGLTELPATGSFEKSSRINFDFETLPKQALSFINSLVI